MSQATETVKSRSTSIEAQAFVLRRIEFGDTSLILRLLTEKHGMVTVLAKGAHREKSPWLGMLDLPCWLEVEVKIHATREVQLLTDARLRESFPRLRKDLQRFYLALFAVELVEEAGQPAGAPEIFHLFRDFLLALDEGRVCPETLWISFELGFLEACGLRPALRECAACGSALPEKSEIVFSAADGGALCARCVRPGQHSLARIPGPALVIAEKLSRMPIAQLGKIVIAPELLRQIQRALDSFLQYHWGRTPRTRNLMDSLLR